MIPHSTLEQLARELDAATVERRQIEPLSDRFPMFDVEDAYQVQQLQLERRLGEGDSLLGHKVGLTSEAMRRQLGIASPDYGYLLKSMLYSSDSAIPSERFIQPRAEPEIALILGEDVPLDDITALAVSKATRAIAPALEIIDSRIHDWRITLYDTVADNASAGAIVVGNYVEWKGTPAPRDVRCRLLLDDRELASGRGDAVMGDPFEAVAWLGRTLAARGTQMRADQILMPGSLTSAFPFQKGETITADFENLGIVVARFQ